MLEIIDLHAEIENTKILNGIDLKLETGYIHVIMGPNGSGKSTLAKTLMGSPEVDVTKGKIIIDGFDITDKTPDIRSRKGLFLANQYPVEIPGVNLSSFLRIAINSHRGSKNKISLIEFRKLLNDNLKLIGLDPEFADRNINEGFSGGEKKKCEILQLAILAPKIAILDETDSGLDVESLKQIFTTVATIQKQTKMTLIIITHYDRVFEYINADFVHVIKKGKIVKSGNKNLIQEIQKKGFKK